MPSMRQMRGTLLRSFLSLGRSSQSNGGRDRVLQSPSFQGRDYLLCSEHFRPRWLSTLRSAELGHAGASKTPGQTLPDVQHASLLIQQFEHEYETILCYPRGISTCSAEELIFISDSLHDRIIITDETGGVLDYIGSSAGFEDGPFESARLRRPSSIVYDTEQKCLYIADCENHAIRRARLSSRMLDTVYPKQEERQGLVQRWLRGLGFMQNSSPNKDSNRHQISYPWHLSIVPSGKIIAATQGFEKLWMIEVDTGAVTEEPDQEPASNFKKLTESKSAELENWMHVHETLASRGLAYEGLFSSLVSQVAVLKSEVLVIDTGMHQVFRLDLSTGHLTTMPLTNLALLGLPAWWTSDDDPQVACSLERLHQDRPEEAITTFKVQPGRCMIGIDVVLPSGTVLAEPLTDDCLWRQGRGSLVELSTFDGELMSHKITAAQQYMDDLYELEVTIDKEMEEDPSQDMPVPQQTSSGLPFYSSIDVSLGTGEVIFDAVLYLKRDKLAGTDSQPVFSHRNDSYIGHSMKVTVPSCQKLNDFPDGALLAKHLHFRVRCEVSADAPQTGLLFMLLQLQIGVCGLSYIEKVEVTNFSTVTLPRQATLNFLGMVIIGPLPGPSQAFRTRGQPGRHGGLPAYAKPHSWRVAWTPSRAHRACLPSQISSSPLGFDC